MKNNAALVCLGSEITKGIIQDKYGLLVSKELRKLNYHMTSLQCLPDDGSVSEYLEQLIKNNSLVIITGGLGPTSDDLTRDLIAKTIGRKLLWSEESFSRLKAKIGDRAYGANEKQAYIIEGFSPLENLNGTAEGFYGYVEDTLLISLPGPPHEMEPMFYSSVLSLLKKGKAEKEIEVSTFLIPEARLEEITTSIDLPISWGTRFQEYLISLYIKGEQADKAYEELEKIVSSSLLMKGHHTPIEIITKTLLDNNLTISSCESCTGGLASKLLTDQAGSSQYFLGGLCSYSNEAKQNILNIDAEIINKYGAVSTEVAVLMAENALKLFNTDVSFSITGVAGPGESENKKVGTVCFGFAAKGKETQCVKLNISGSNRATIRKKSAMVAFLLSHFFIQDKQLIDIIAKWVYI